MILNLSLFFPPPFFIGFSFEVFEQGYSKPDKVHRTKVLVVYDEEHEVTWLRCHPTKVITMRMGFVLFCFIFS